MTQKHPHIGRQAWYESLPVTDRQDAQRMVLQRRPVVVFRTDEHQDAGHFEYAVVFTLTGMWADIFRTEAAARRYAEKWNQKCREFANAD